MKKAIAEFIGTFTLVLFGCGSAVISSPAVGDTTVGVLGIKGSKQIKGSRLIFPPADFAWADVTAQ